MSFEKFVSHAPRYLFQLGFVLLILAVLSTVTAALMSGNDGLIVAALFGAALNGLQLAIVPWAAAAALWRFDKFLDDKA